MRTHVGGPRGAEARGAGRGTGRALSRRQVGLAVLAAATIGVGAVSVGTGGPGERVPRLGSDADGAAAQVVADVMGRRDAALVAADAAALDAVTAPGSPARAADAELGASLGTTVLVGVETEVRDVVVQEGAVTDGAFTAEVRLAQAGWRAEDDGGRRTYPPQEACAVLRVVHAPPGWAVAESRTCPSTG